jgi:hypothetical protein
MSTKGNRDCNSMPNRRGHQPRNRARRLAQCPENFNRCSGSSRFFRLFSDLVSAERRRRRKSCRAGGNRNQNGRSHEAMKDHFNVDCRCCSHRIKTPQPRQRQIQYMLPHLLCAWEEMFATTLFDVLPLRFLFPLPFPFFFFFFASPLLLRFAAPYSSISNVPTTSPPEPPGDRSLSS